MMEVVMVMVVMMEVMVVMVVMVIVVVLTKVMVMMVEIKTLEFSIQHDPLPARLPVTTL